MTEHLKHPTENAESGRRGPHCASPERSASRTIVGVGCNLILAGK